MRSDGFFDDKVRQWEKSENKAFVDLFRPNGVGDVSIGFSAGEKNHLFVNRGAVRFTDISGVSGLDSSCDSRSFAHFDYDRDGFTDIVVINANEPKVELFRNRIGEVLRNRKAPEGNLVALRFVGGNRDGKASQEFGPRDGYGAVARVQVGDRVLLRENRCGEGLAAQNSATILVGIGTAEKATKIEVKWPSGKTATHEGVPAGSLVTLFEDAAETKDGSGVAIEPYHSAASAESSVVEAPGPRLALASVGDPERKTSLRMYTTMATWCVSCKRELPQIERLRTAFGDRIALFGVPIDEKDDRQRLEAYAKSHEPAYRLLLDLPDGETAAVKKVILDALKSEALPATIVTDGEGKVVWVDGGVPTISELVRLMEKEGGDL